MSARVRPSRSTTGLARGLAVIAAVLSLLAVLTHRLFEVAASAWDDVRAPGPALPDSALAGIAAVAALLIIVWLAVGLCLSTATAVLTRVHPARTLMRANETVTPLLIRSWVAALFGVALAVTPLTARASTTAAHPPTAAITQSRIGNSANTGASAVIEAADRSSRPTELRVGESTPVAGTAGAAQPAGWVPQRPPGAGDTQTSITAGAQSSGRQQPARHAESLGLRRVLAAPSRSASRQVVPIVAEERRSEAPTPAVTQPHDPQARLVVVRGAVDGVHDSLWRISEREFGSSRHWIDIYRLNVGRTQADGRVLHDPNLIFPGWVLRLPARSLSGSTPATTTGAWPQDTPPPSAPPGMTTAPGQAASDRGETPRPATAETPPKSAPSRAPLNPAATPTVQAQMPLITPTTPSTPADAPSTGQDSSGPFPHTTTASGQHAAPLPSPTDQHTPAPVEEQPGGQTSQHEPPAGTKQPRLSVTPTTAAHSTPPAPERSDDDGRAASTRTGEDQDDRDDDGVQLGQTWMSWPMAAVLAALAAAVWQARRRRYRYTEPFIYTFQPAPSPEHDDDNLDSPAPWARPAITLDYEQDLYVSGAAAADSPRRGEGNGTDEPDSAPPRHRAALPGNQITQDPRHAEQRPDQAPEHDPDLQALPNLVNRLRDAVRAHNEDAAADPRTPASRGPGTGSTVTGPKPSGATDPITGARPADRPDGYPLLTAPPPFMATAVTVPVPSTSPDEIRTRTDSGGTHVTGAPAIPPQGMSMDGAGASAAARALLIATLSSGSRSDPDKGGRVITTAATLDALFEGAAPDLRHLPGMHVVDHLDAALSAIDEHILTRRRIHDEHDEHDPLTTGAGSDSGREKHDVVLMPEILLLVTAPAGGSPVAARLLTSLHLGAPLHIRGVLLGAWPPGQSLTVAADGHTGTAASPPSNDARPVTRIAVLDIPGSRALLQVITEARTGCPAQPIAPSEGDGNSDQPSRDLDLPRTQDTVAPETVTHQISASPEAEALPAPDRSHSSSPMAGARVAVRVLGRPAILDRDGRPVPGLRTGAAQLLVILAVHRNGHPLMDIMEKIWPDATTRRAAERLSTEAANLRRTVRQALGRTDDRTQATNAIINTGSFYNLNQDLLDVDLWRFGAAFAAAQAADDPVVQSTYLRAAICEHTGPLAQGRDYPWADVVRHQIHRDAIRTRLRLAALTTDPAERAHIVNEAADLDPVSEDLARRAMRASAAAGDPETVRNRLGTLRAALNDINEEPTHETLALITDLQRSGTDARGPHPHETE